MRQIVLSAYMDLLILTKLYLLLSHCEDEETEAQSISTLISFNKCTLNISWCYTWGFCWIQS